jgi:hypothetical protein
MPGLAKPTVCIGTRAIEKNASAALCEPPPSSALDFADERPARSSITDAPAARSDGFLRFGTENHARLSSAK